jgi:VCBS repeat protein/IPT/TIG domain-containing protein
VATSTSGQPAVRADAFEVVPPPTLLSFDPPFSSVLGGTEITLTGSDFRSSMGLLVDGVLQPVTATYADATTLRFPAPTHGAGFVTLGVVDLGSQLRSELTSAPFEFVTTPVINRVRPALVPVLGGETVTLDGVLFAADDSVFLETTTPGSYEEVSATQTTFVDATRHRFVTPVRPKGDYRVYVIDAAGRPNTPRTRTITYFDFADVTAASGFGTSIADSGDAVTSALLDVDGDGDLDLALARSGGATAAATPQTRVLLNDGHGAFTDATASVMPPAGTDDWRADRMVAADIDGDGHTDLVIATNSLTVPPSNRSHTRLLMNERRGGTGLDADERVLRDRTIDLMAPVRTMQRYGAFGGDGSSYVSDDWRGLDVWVGDLDANGSGPPDIVLTHDEAKDDDNPNADVFKSGVYCGSYCASPYGSSYAYSFYWGGSRAFVWDKNARGGLGRYRFDANFFPRKSGPVVPTEAPGGIGFPVCSAHYNSICKSMFTPFTGKRLAVGDLNADGKPDVAVVADHAVQRRFTINGPLTTISSLQVALQGFNAQDGAKVTDVTAKLTALGGDLSGDAVAIGRTGYPDGNPDASIALARAASTPGLRLLRFHDDAGTLSVADVSAATLPAPVGADALQAGEVRFVDIDGDGDQDLVLLAPAAPGGTQAALRLLRNAGSGDVRGVFARPWDALVEAAVLPGDPFEGAALSIGDLTGDGLPEFAVSRALHGTQPADTRILSIQR